MTLKTKAKATAKPGKRIDRKSPPSMLTKKQVADELCVSPATVTAWCRNGNLEHLDLPTADPDSTHEFIRIPWEAFVKFEESFKRRSKQPAAKGK